MFYLTKWAPQAIFLGVRTLKLGFTLENERPRQDFLAPQPISPDLRIWSPENEGGTTTRGGTTSLIPPDARIHNTPTRAVKKLVLP